MKAQHLSLHPDPRCLVLYRLQRGETWGLVVDKEPSGQGTVDRDPSHLPSLFSCSFLCALRSLLFRLQSFFMSLKEAGAAAASCWFFSLKPPSSQATLALGRPCGAEPFFRTSCSFIGRLFCHHVWTFLCAELLYLESPERGSCSGPVTWELLAGDGWSRGPGSLPRQLAKESQPLPPPPPVVPFQTAVMN